MAAHPQLPATRDGVASPPLSVSTELEAIFLDATGLPSSRAARLPPNRKIRSFLPGQARRSRIPVATFGAVAAAALLGLSAGAVMLSRPAAVPAPRVAALAPAAATPRLAAPPTAPVVTLAAADESATDLAAPKVQRASTPRAERPPRGRHATHADLMTADRRLRHAYARAVDAGVPRPVLARYRDRWADLRHDASWRPDRVATGYDAMAGDLTRLSARHHHAHRAPQRRGWSPWRRLW
jgi:hypothetical protein